MQMNSFRMRCFRKAVWFWWHLRFINRSWKYGSSTLALWRQPWNRLRCSVNVPKIGLNWSSEETNNEAIKKCKSEQQWFADCDLLWFVRRCGLIVCWLVWWEPLFSNFVLSSLPQLFYSWFFGPSLFGMICPSRGERFKTDPVETEWENASGSNMCHETMVAPIRSSPGTLNRRAFSVSDVQSVKKFTGRLRPLCRTASMLQVGGAFQ